MQGGNDARLVNWLGEPAEEHVSQSPIHLYPIPVFMRFHMFINKTEGGQRREFQAITKNFQVDLDNRDFLNENCVNNISSMLHNVEKNRKHRVTFQYSCNIRV